MIPHTISTTLKRIEFFRKQVRACEEELLKTDQQEFHLEHLTFNQETWFRICKDNLADHKKKLHSLENLLKKLHRHGNQMNLSMEPIHNYNPLS